MGGTPFKNRKRHYQCQEEQCDYSAVYKKDLEAHEKAAAALKAVLGKHFALIACDTCAKRWCTKQSRARHRCALPHDHGHDHDHDYDQDGEKQRSVAHASQSAPSTAEALKILEVVNVLDPSIVEDLLRWADRCDATQANGLTQNSTTHTRASQPAVTLEVPSHHHRHAPSAVAAPLDDLFNNDAGEGTPTGTEMLWHPGSSKKQVANANDGQQPYSKLPQGKLRLCCPNSPCAFLANHPANIERHRKAGILEIAKREGRNLGSHVKCDRCGKDFCTPRSKASHYCEGERPEKEEQEEVDTDALVAYDICNAYGKRVRMHGALQKHDFQARSVATQTKAGTILQPAKSKTHALSTAASFSTPSIGRTPQHAGDNDILSSPVSAMSTPSKMPKNAPPQDSPLLAQQQLNPETEQAFLDLNDTYQPHSTSSPTRSSFLSPQQPYAGAEEAFLNFDENTEWPVHWLSPPNPFLSQQRIDEGTKEAFLDLNDANQLPLTTVQPHVPFQPSQDLQTATEAFPGLNHATHAHPPSMPPPDQLPSGDSRLEYTELETQQPLVSGELLAQYHFLDRLGYYFTLEDALAQDNTLSAEERIDLNFVRAVPPPRSP